VIVIACCEDVGYSKL